MAALLVIRLLTYGGALAALANPFIGLLIYVAFSLLKPEWIWYDSIPEGNYSFIIGLAMLASWALHGFGRWRLGAGGAVAAALIAYWLWIALGATLAPNQTVAWEFVAGATKIVLPFLVGVTTIDSVAKLRQLAWVIVLSQGAVSAALNLDYLGGFNRLVEADFAGMDNNVTAAALVTCVGLAFFLGLGTSRWQRKAIAFACGLLTAHVILFSQSRGGMLALLVTGLSSFFLLPRRGWYYVVLALAVFVLLQLSTSEARTRFLTTFADSGERDASANNRLQLWQDSFDAMVQNPLMGVGPAHWPLIADRYGWPPGTAAHCLWLQTGAELGVPGLALLLTFYGICAMRLLPLARQRGDPVGDPWLRDTARMVLAALAGFVVAAQFLSISGIEAPYYVALLGAGALKLSRPQEAADAESVSLPVSAAALSHS